MVVQADLEVVNFWATKFRNFNFYPPLDLVGYRSVERAKHALMSLCSTCFVTEEEKNMIEEMIEGSSEHKRIVQFYLDKINIL